MNIFEYLGMDHEIYQDENGNAYFDEYTGNAMGEIRDLIGFDAYESCFLSKEKYDELKECQIFITDDEDIESIKGVRRPYYRMRGKSVTEEQAFDLIRRLDNFFGHEIAGSMRGYIGSVNFDNWLINKNHFPQGYGWVHVDGTIGTNGITQKYPNIQEFVLEWIQNLIAFPYLDLIIAVTYWDEMPLEVLYHREEYDLLHTKAYDELFYEAVEVGIHVHDHKVEILDPKETVKRYKEYDRLYGSRREIFVPEYYQNNHITQVDEEYLRRCIESYGLDADEELSKVPEYIWKGGGCC